MAPSYFDESSRDRDDLHHRLVNANAKLHLSRLDEDHPLFKLSDNTTQPLDAESASFSNANAIDNQIFLANWARLLGCDLVFDDYGELMACVQDHLIADPLVKVRARPQTQANDDMDIDGPDPDMKTAFLKRAIATAKSKLDCT